MRNLKKQVVSMALAALMIVGLAAALPSTAQAASILDPNSTTGSLTIQKKDETGQKPLQGAGFTIYKVIGITPKAGGAPDYTKEEPYGDILAQVNPDALGNYNAEELDDLALQLANASTGGTENKTNANGEAKFENLALGYYLVKETTTPAGYVTGKPFLVAIPSTNNYNDDTAAGTEWRYDVTVEPKNSKVSVEKDYGPDNDGTHKVGNFVSYTVETAIPNYTEDYTDPAFKIYDIMDDGLEVVKDDVAHPVTVKVNTQEVTAGAGTYTVTLNPSATGTDPDLKIEFASTYIKQHVGESVEVTYYAKITSAAVKVELVNRVELEYQHKPGEMIDADKRPHDEEKVYSFQIKVEKFTNSGETKPLEGAEFMIYTKPDLTIPPDGFDKPYTSNSQGMLTIKGLDEGTYYLKETKSPAGYTLLTSPIKVEITAIRDSQTKKPTGKFTIEVNDKQVDEGSTQYTTRLEPNTGAVIVAVENYKGFSLPATGGMGIALFLLIGAAGIITVSAVMMKKSRRS